jgi:hypothetical protein
MRRYEWRPERSPDMSRGHPLSCECCGTILNFPVRGADDLTARLAPRSTSHNQKDQPHDA